MRRSTWSIALSHSSLNRRTSLNDMVDAQLFVNIAKTVFGGYSAMMLLMPKKMVSDHFKAEADPSAHASEPAFFQCAPSQRPIADLPPRLSPPRTSQ